MARRLEIATPLLPNRISATTWLAVLLPGLLTVDACSSENVHQEQLRSMQDGQIQMSSSRWMICSSAALHSEAHGSVPSQNAMRATMASRLQMRSCAADFWQGSRQTRCREAGWQKRSMCGFLQRLSVSKRCRMCKPGTKKRASGTAKGH